MPNIYPGLEVIYNGGSGVVFDTSDLADGYVEIIANGYGAPDPISVPVASLTLVHSR